MKDRLFIFYLTTLLISPSISLHRERSCWRIHRSGQSDRISATQWPTSLVAYSLEALLVRISGGLPEFASKIEKGAEPATVDELVDNIYRLDEDVSQHKGRFH